MVAKGLWPKACAPKARAEEKIMAFSPPRNRYHMDRNRYHMDRTANIWAERRLRRAPSARSEPSPARAALSLSRLSAHSACLVCENR